MDNKNTTGSHQPRFTMDYKVPPSMADITGRLGVADSFNLFMDLASYHSDMIGNGVRDLMKTNRYWVTTKTLIQFFKRPSIGSVVELATWPEDLKALRGNRDYAVYSKSGELLMAGKTEWIILDKNINKYIDVRALYPEDFPFDPEKVCPQSYAKIVGDFPEEAFASYKVLNLDTDFVGHMNNVAYVKAFANCYTAKEWVDLGISEMEIHFRRPSFEGDVLEFSRRSAADGYTEVCARVAGEIKAVIRYK